MREDGGIKTLSLQKRENATPIRVYKEEQFQKTNIRFDVAAGIEGK